MKRSHQADYRKWKVMVRTSDTIPGEWVADSYDGRGHIRAKAFEPTKQAAQREAERLRRIYRK